MTKMNMQMPGTWRSPRTVQTLGWGAAMLLLVASAAWACTVPHKLVLLPNSGPSPNNNVSAAATAHVDGSNPTNGTFNVWMDPTKNGLPSGCVGSGNDMDVGDITYVKGAGQGKVQIPAGLAPGKYWLCAEPDTGNMRAQYEVKL